MGKTWLFSPIGNTDPIKYYRDGSMLHIARVYRPDVIYLYLSKEMVDIQRKDNRYVRTLEKLGEKLGHLFEVKTVEREELVNVHDYDFFFHEFREQIAEIESKMEEDDRLLVNMASGTPAMKSALLVIAAFAEYRFQPVQVGSPKAASNLEFEERLDYDVDTNWDLDEDNEPGFENRCRPIKSVNLNWLLKTNMIEKHVRAYDYHAAFVVGKELGKDLDDRTRILLEIAMERLRLNQERLKVLLPQCGYNLMVLDGSEKQRLFEYILGLKIRLQREDYADFVRGITPAVVDLMEMLLKPFCGIRLSDYCYNADGILKWSQSKLQGTRVLQALNQRWAGGFKYGSVYSSHLNVLFQCFCADPVLREKVDAIRRVEEKVRNPAAHDIVSVTKQWIRKLTGKTPEEIMRLLMDLCRAAGAVPHGVSWNSYDKMNQIIIEELKRSRLER